MKQQAFQALKRGTISVITLLGTVLLVVSVVFFAFRLLPGDPSDIALGEQASAEERAAFRHKLHLDAPIGVQYAIFLRGIAGARFGFSLRDPSKDAMRLVLESLSSTIVLATMAVSFATAFGLMMGIFRVASTRTYVRSVFRFLTQIFVALPMLSLAPFALWLFAVKWRVMPLPADPSAGLRGDLFAALLLSIPLSGAVGRITTFSLHQQTSATFLQTARAKGVSEPMVWFKHALRAALAPIITVVASQLGALLGGAIVLERLLERQGLGSTLSEALLARDLPVIEAAVVVSTAFFVLSQNLGWWLQGVLDPRTRSS